MVVKVPDEDFSDITLASGDIYGDDIEVGDGHGMEVDKVADEVVANAETFPI